MKMLPSCEGAAKLRQKPWDPFRVQGVGLEGLV